MSDPQVINERGLALVKDFEGLQLKAYLDEVGVWTIGWGHTGLQHKDGTVYRGRTITLDKAEELLRYDMHQFEARVRTFVKVPLNDDQFSALVSFDFNTGWLDRATLTKKLNAKLFSEVPAQLMRFTRAGGTVLNGLVRRRLSEAWLWMGRSKVIATMDDVRKYRETGVI